VNASGSTRAINIRGGAGNNTLTDFDATTDTEVIFLDGLLTGVFQSGISAGGNTGITATTENTTDTKILIDTNGDGTAEMEILLQNLTASDIDITDFLVS